MRYTPCLLLLALVLASPLHAQPANEPLPTLEQLNKQFTDADYTDLQRQLARDRGVARGRGVRLARQGPAHPDPRAAIANCEKLIPATQELAAVTDLKELLADAREAEALRKRADEVLAYDYANEGKYNKPPKQGR